MANWWSGIIMKLNCSFLRLFDWEHLVLIALKSCNGMKLTTIQPTAVSLKCLTCTIWEWHVAENLVKEDDVAFFLYSITNNLREKSLPSEYSRLQYALILGNCCKISRNWYEWANDLEWRMHTHWRSNEWRNCALVEIELSSGFNLLNSQWFVDQIANRYLIAELHTKLWYLYASLKEEAPQVVHTISLTRLTRFALGNALIGWESSTCCALDFITSRV